jgi:hypothetical protein
MKIGLTRKCAAGVFLAAAMILCGCATISESSHAYLGSPAVAPTTPEQVQIHAAEPKLPKERLGEIILSVDGNPSRQRLEHKFKTAAAKMGATGVFIVSDKTHIYPYAYWDWWGPVASEDWHRLIVGVAFRAR